MSKITFAIGGVHPDDAKLSRNCAIEVLPLPQTMYVSMAQHLGAPAKPIVAVGDKVKTGQVIAHSDASELGKNYLEEKDTLGNKLAQKLYGEDDREFELSFGGEKYMVFVESIEGDWRMVSLVNTEVFYEPMMIIVGALLLFFVLEAIVFISILRSQSEKNLALASAEAAESVSP